MKRRERKHRIAALKGQEGGKMLPGAGKAGAFREQSNRQERRDTKRHLNTGRFEE